MVGGESVLGQGYNKIQKLYEVTNNIEDSLTLREHVDELARLLKNILGCDTVCLLPSETGDGNLNTHFVASKVEKNPLSHLDLDSSGPIVKFLKLEQRLLTKRDLVTFSEEKSEISAATVPLDLEILDDPLHAVGNGGGAQRRGGNGSPDPDLRDEPLAGQVNGGQVGGSCPG